MTQQEFNLSGKTCRLTSFGKPRVLLVEPIDRNDLDFLGRDTKPTPSPPFVLPSCATGYTAGQGYALGIFPKNAYL